MFRRYENALTINVDVEAPFKNLKILHLGVVEVLWWIHVPETKKMRMVIMERYFEVEVTGRMRYLLESNGAVKTISALDHAASIE